jgi:ATP-binding cassette subfamily B protein
MVAAFYGKNIPLSLIKEYSDVTRLGVSIQDVLSGCKKIGLDAIVARVKEEELTDMPLPAILYWRQNHYVVLYRIENKRNKKIYHIADPDYGKAQLSESEFLKEWTTDGHGIACVVEPTEDFFKIERNITFKDTLKEYFKSFKYLRGYSKNISIALFFSAITFVCTWLIPFILQRIIDDGIGKSNLNFVFILLFAQLCLFFGNIIFSFLSNRLIFKMGLKIGINIATDYIYKLVRLPISFFDTKLGTDLLQRLNDENKIKDFLTYTVNNIVLLALNFLVYSSILLYYNLYVFLVFVLFTGLTLLLAKLTLKTRKYLNYSLFSNYSEKRNTEYELVNGMMEIKTNTAQDHFLNKWKNVQEKINSVSVKNLYVEYYLSSGASLLNVLRDIIITGGCAFLVINGDLSLGMMMTITYILGLLSGSISQITQLIKNFQDSLLAYDRLEEVQKLPEENQSKLLRIPKEQHFHNGFVLDDVSFKYAGSFNPYVLINVCAKIPLNKITAIVGASGSGKTTLLKLLLAFYYPQKGEMYLNNHKMSDINSTDWHQRCGVVMQDGHIFSGTIANNIALSEETPDLERLKSAAKMACIDDFIERLPMKYNTKIGNSGLGLSGGQKQRILISRAIYRNPEFIFFDEATSSLDANNEMQIMNNLKEFYKGRTVVIIAHRLSTVKDADNILVLDKGQLVEEGNHRELSDLKGMYYNLVKNQLELGT